MAIYDVTVPLRRGMVTYGGNEPGPEVTYTKLLSRGDSNLSTLFLGSRTGTHVDAPHHFIDGSTVVEKSLEALVGPVQVVEHASAEHITATDIEAFMVPRIPAGCCSKLRTGSSGTTTRFTLSSWGSRKTLQRR